jgi:hypothetical protein
LIQQYEPLIIIIINIYNNNKLNRINIIKLTGTVDFSTTILSDVATSAILRAHNSQFLIFAARPEPIPDVLVGVFTLTKIISASTIAASISVEKNKFL